MTVAPPATHHIIQWTRSMIKRVRATANQHVAIQSACYGSASLVRPAYGQRGRRETGEGAGAGGGRCVTGRREGSLGGGRWDQRVSDNAGEGSAAYLAG